MLPVTITPVSLENGMLIEPASNLGRWLLGRSWFEKVGEETLRFAQAWNLPRVELRVVGSVELTKAGSLLQLCW